ncbi:MAG: DUF4881 domain-containing protein [Humidesulfovibrio sp.]|uniref:DUF4881 domain-containing protein n=1 Tax=Humidesulfovibrio sp. TaxID=2910988 RepID=UPI0027F9B960|nr:DUF4881 domain-containing protein [Humidesulfovibrio sp.]MDQ7834677.1 DUF4881 domain-containing protein [Humidesulfovibrio sp.]
MNGKSMWRTILVALPLMLLLGCTDYGKVDQGRVVKFDPATRTMTFIRDKANDTQNPDYTYLPPITYVLPTDPAENGPDPKAGGRMKIDNKKNQITIYDPATQNFKTIDFVMVDFKENIDKNHPLVYDKEADKAKKFPVVDKDKKTVTIYSGRQKTLSVIQLPEEYFAMPESTWDAGDEARVYYKEDGKALRYMNITKTNIFKK